MPVLLKFVVLVSVSVSAESIGIGAKIFFAETETFLFSIFTHFFLLLKGINSKSFYKLEYKPSPSKIIQKYLMFGRKFDFGGPFMMEKNTSCY